MSLLFAQRTDLRLDQFRQRMHWVLGSVRGREASSSPAVGHPGGRDYRLYRHGRYRYGRYRYGLDRYGLYSPHFVDYVGSGKEP